MKKKLFLGILSFMTTLFATGVNLPVLAANVLLFASSTSITVGDSFTLYVNLNSVAAWNVHMATSGPVSGGCVINQVDASVDAMNTSKSFSVTCSATNTGVISASLSGDITTESGDNYSVSDTINITVNSTPAPKAQTEEPSAPSSAPSSTSSQNQNSKEKFVQKSATNVEKQNDDVAQTEIVDDDVMSSDFDIEEHEMEESEENGEEEILLHNECEPCSPLFVIISIIEGAAILGIVAWLIYKKYQIKKYK